jgi:competence ComEA-like helix-hairpin-helix protein
MTQQSQTRLWTHSYLLACAAGLTMLICLAAGMLIDRQGPLLNDDPEMINPNTAPLGSLVRLDGIGKARALDIIHYRQNHPAFKTAEDMENISGIGPKTAAKLKPYLTFETDREEQ